MVVDAKVSLPIPLRQDQVAALRALAAERQVMLEELVGEAVDALLAGVPENPAALVEQRRAEEASAPLVGTIVEDDLDNEEAVWWPEDRPIEEHPLWALVDLGDAGVTDLAENHDRYLVEYELESNRLWPEKSS
jgi:hypothetical protein